MRDHAESNRLTALHHLRESGPMRASDLGWMMWGHTTESAMRGEGSHRQNKFCRSAGKLLRALEREGKVTRRVHGNCFLWDVKAGRPIDEIGPLSHRTA